MTTKSRPNSMISSERSEHSEHPQGERPSDVQSPSTPEFDRTNTARSGRRASTRMSSIGIPLRKITTMLSVHMKPVKPVAAAPTPMESLKAIACASWLNVLLIFIPLSWAFHFALPDSYTLIFVFSFLAIIPLAKLLAFATEELSLRLGQTIAGLLNATLGNAVELIVAIIALLQCQLQVVQSSLIGSVLSNLLLVLGMCFFAGGTRFSEQGFGASAAQVNSSLLILSVIAVLLPAAFYFSNTNNSQLDSSILSVSHGVAIILLFIYGSYLAFQLFSHKQMYEDHNDDVVKSTRYRQREKGGHIFPRPSNAALSAARSRLRLSRKRHTKGSVNAGDARTDTVTEDVGSAGDAPMDGISPVHTRTADDPELGQTDEEDDEEHPQLSVMMSVVLLVFITVFVAVTAEFLVDSINGLTASGGISKEFVGMILLPIVGNAAEHVTAVTVSVKDKLTLSIGVAVGSSIQIALFVIPFIVTLAWMIGKPLTLLFDPFESIALFLSVLTVNYVVADGKSNWLEGMILMCLYVILAVSFWFYIPATSALNTC